MAIVASLINMKGGVGKSTVCFNIAAYAAQKKNLKVLVVDLDPQSNVSTYLLGEGKYVAYIKKGGGTVLATIGLPLLARSINEFQIQHTDQHIEIAGIVFNDADPSRMKKEHNKARADVNDLAAKHSWRVFENEIRHSDSFPTGARSGKAIFNTDYARWWVVDEVNECLDEILDGLGL
jgi:chromosome partitioning protein